MPAYPFNPSVFHWTAPHPHKSGTFRPTGKLVEHGNPAHLRANPSTWDAEESMVGRLLVGFSVGQTPTYTVNDLIELVEHVRKRQGANPSASFVSQKGIYQHHDGTTVHEDGCQVFVVNLSNLSLSDFKKQMVELAEIVCRDMEQEEVIVEIQVNGVSKTTMGVGP